MLENLLYMGSGSSSWGGREFDVIAGNETLGYLGIISQSKLMSQEYLLDTLGVMNYNRVNLDTNYLGFMIQGKLAFLSQKAIVQNCNLKYIDELGYRYGKDVTLKGKDFGVRTIKSSEVNTLIYPLIAGQTLTTVKWDNLNLSDLFTPDHAYMICQETVQRTYQRVRVNSKTSNINSALSFSDHTTYNLTSPPSHQTFRPFLIEK